jgi:hypothetical protein
MRSALRALSSLAMSKRRRASSAGEPPANLPHPSSQHPWACRRDSRTARAGTADRSTSLFRRCFQRGPCRQSPAPSGQHRERSSRERTLAHSAAVSPAMVSSSFCSSGSRSELEDGPRHRGRWWEARTAKASRAPRIPLGPTSPLLPVRPGERARRRSPEPHCVRELIVCPQTKVGKDASARRLTVGREGLCLHRLSASGSTRRCFEANPPPCARRPFGHGASRGWARRAGFQAPLQDGG